jgi:anthranilate phosphoribosyltransferase
MMTLDINACHLDSEAQQQMFRALQKVATGPHLSKDLSLEETLDNTLNILQGKIDPVRAIMFFLALRMKRETLDENRGILGAIIAASSQQQLDIPELVDIGEPYNGFNRSLPATPFLPAVLASLDIPAYSHGIATVGPKYGVTHKQILAAGGIDTDMNVAQASQQIAERGWAYIDQTHFCPALADLYDFRKLVIKRLPLTTCEVMAGPLKAKKNHIITGFVHKGYQKVYLDLAQYAEFDSALAVRGVEGGITPSLRQAIGGFSQWGDAAVQEVEFSPQEYGIQADSLAPEVPPGLSAPSHNTEIAEAAFQAGVAALSGTQNTAYQAMVYAGAIILRHLGKYDSPADCADAIRHVLNNGDAKARLLG